MIVKPLLNASQVGARFGCSGKTVLRQAYAGKFPAPVRISPRCVGWPPHVVDEWFERATVQTALEFGGKPLTEVEEVAMASVG